VIRYAGQNSLPAVWVGPNDPTDMVLFNDSRIESNGGVAMETRADKLHQLQMNNVMFSGNSGDVVEIRTFDGFEYFALADSVTLRPQPGLRGYLIESDGLQVPQGMTLTLAAGTQLMGNSGTYVGVLGHLASMGTASQPVTMTSVLDTAGGEWIGLIVYGSAYLEQTRLRYGDGASLMAWPNDPNDEVVLLDSIIEGTSGYPIHTRADKWHQLGLTGTQFISNSWPMIGVETHDGSIGYTPQASLDLVQYPGLFGYEMLGGGLVIEPGVVITMAGNQSLLVPAGEQIEVGGKLAIQATWGEEVILSGVGGTFEGVRVVSGGVIDWYHVDINGAGQTTGWGLLVESGGEAYLSTSRINNGAGDGLVVAGGVVDMECGQLMGNNGNGVTVTGDVGSVLRMAGVDVVGNTGWGVENLNTEGVWAVYNWWGAASGPSGVGPGTGSSITGTVMYEPWLSAAGCMDWVDLAAAAAGPADVFINEPLTHTLRMMHQGGIEASGLVLMAEVTGGDLLGMSIEPAGSCAYSGLGFTCTVASLLAGQESVVTVMISPTLGGVVTSTVGVFSTVNGDMVMGNNEAVVTTTVRLPLVAERPVGTAVTLRWGAEPRACLYEIHRGETPYFELTGVTAIDKVAALEYTDVAGAGDVGVNYYYKVVAVDCSLEPVGETLRVGVFDFGVVEGS
ncbi:MAG TPA: hypothetical protein VLL52_14660, partial [Anaerolineae bacterium]|nr:hypothetical protein [Anaerolineae bacterium]